MFYAVLLMSPQIKNQIYTELACLQLLAYLPGCVFSFINILL